MLTKTAPKHLDLSSTQEVARNAGNFVSRKIWLPKLLYDCLPYFYLTAGFAAFFATLYISDWFWVLPHYILFSAACLHLSYAVYRRRTRTTKRDPDPSDQTPAG
jgi:hypothetical protein